MTQYLLSVHMTESDCRDPRPRRWTRSTPPSTLQHRGQVERGVGVRRRAARPVDGDRRRRHEGSDVTVTDGPYAETKEQIGGFWVIEAADLDAALDWAKKGVGGMWRRRRGAPVPGRAGELSDR